MKPYYEQDGIVIYHGDCREVMMQLDRKFDLVITSPPYNLGGEPWPHLGNWKQGDSAGGKSKWRNGSDAASGIQCGEHSDDMRHDQYVTWQHRVLTDCWTLINEDGAIFYNHKPRVIGAKAWLPLELNPGLPLRQIVIWKRSGGMNFNPTCYLPIHEWLMIFAKPDFRLKSRAASGVGDVWEIHQESDTPHPAPFPEALPARAIETSSAMSVLDPFCGWGTTLVAAKRLRREAVGIDIDERYCEMAAKRLAQGALPLGMGA